MNTIRRIRYSLLLLLLPLLLQGCGFHLRGSGSGPVSQLPADISPVYIQGVNSSDRLYSVLTQALKAGGVEVTGNPDAAASRLQISGRRSDREVLAIDSTGKVIEYELIEGLSFSLIANDGSERVKPQQINVAQSYISADVAILGKADEESALRENMYQRLSDQMVRRLVAQLR